METRAALKQGDRLTFPGMDCRIVRTVGCGSNAIVYEGEYQDATSLQRKHRVLIKELFPYEPGGHIWRDGQGCICRDEQGEEAWALHRRSFERGNSIHLQLLSQFPEQTGGNLNTYALNRTLYTLLDYSGGRSLDRAIRDGTPQSLSQILLRMRKLLLALSVLHEQGFLHLDISPDNVLLIGQGELERVLLIDYNSIHSRDELTGPGSIYFSAKEGFTAPEVRTGMTRAIGPGTDLFSAACVFYAMLTGSPPTLVQLSRKSPPDASDSPLLRDAPATVKAQLAAILRRGLCVLPDKRYRSCAAMLRDLEELERRLAGVGVTHAALWEAGRKGVQRLIRQNPSLCYVEREQGLYPLRIQEADGTSMPARAWIDAIAGENGTSALLVGEGGMGKSTALLRSALSGTSRYAPAKPAVLYLPLMGVKRGERHFILDHILMELRFDAKTQTMEDARHALITLLNPEAGQGSGAPVRLLLLLDGLNEATGDTSALLEEIRRLSGYGALRMVIATRTVPEGLTLKRAAMVPLQEQDIQSALTAHGLLLPESADMRQLLQTPLMLSLYIQTAKNTGGQVQCQSGRELIDGYLNALCHKAAQDGGRAADYRVEAAVRLVLPAIAREMHRRGRPLNDQELYRTVGRCHRLLQGKVLLRAFPEWIGHSPEMLGDGKQSAEAWHGEMVQRVLWQQLGLLLRGEDGCYRILHQIIQDHLIDIAAENDRRIRSRKARAGLLAALTAVLMACMGLFAYNTWLKPKPYHQNMSEIVLDSALTQYVSCGLQYQLMTQMLSAHSSDHYRERLINQTTEVSRSALIATHVLKQSPEYVIPWSNQPLAFDSLALLAVLPEQRAAEYLRYIQAYQLVLQGETLTTEDQFVSALSQLLEADADYVWLLAQDVMMPHTQGMSEQQRQGFQNGMLALPPELENRHVDLTLGLTYAMERVRENRTRALDKIASLGVMLYLPAITAETGEAPSPVSLAPAEKAGEEATDAGSVVDALLEQLDAFLSVSEQAYAIRADVYARALTFCEAHDYTALVQARLHCDQAQRLLAGLTAPELILTDETLYALMLRGIKTDALELELQRLTGSIRGVPVGMQRCEQMLYEAQLNIHEADVMMQWLLMEQQCDATLMQYDCTLVNSLLLPIADQPQVAAFWTDIPIRYPTLGSHQAQWAADADVLRASGKQLIEDYSSLVSQCSALSGQFTYAINRYNRSVREEAQNTEPLVIDGMPLMVPLPDDWLDPITSELRAGKDTSGVLPNVVMLIDSNVTLDAFNRYVDLLLDLGVQLYMQEGSEEEGLSYTLRIGSRLLMLEWLPGNTAMVGYKPELLSLEYYDYVYLCQ